MRGREETAGEGADRGGRKEERHMGAASPIPNRFSYLLCPLEDRQLWLMRWLLPAQRLCSAQRPHWPSPYAAALEGWVTMATVRP